MKKVDEEFVPEDLFETSENDECPFCETDRELYQNEGKLVCPKCFYVDFASVILFIYFVYSVSYLFSPFSPFSRFSHLLLPIL